MHLELQPLGDEHESSFLELVADFQENDPTVGERLFGNKSWDPKAFKKFAKDCEKERMDWRPRAGKTSLSHYVLLDGGEVCGYGRLRFPIDPSEDLGNLEFYVPPIRRKKSYGTHTLNKLLFEAVRAGLARALVVCDASDSAAIRCIEHNRGERFDDDDKTIARFWIRFR